MTSEPAPQKQPLDGVRVIDFTSIVAGPWATRLLADCGAEVIKVEAVGDGDILRFAPPVNDGMSRVYAHFNRGKKSVSLDLKSPAGLEIARRLIRTADVVVENFRPGVMARLGLDYETVSKANPGLVYCSVSGYGQTGPDAGKAAYAPVVHAASGFDHVMAAAQGGDGAPLTGAVMIADYLAGVYAFGAIQTALLRRERNGVGSHVDVTLIEAMMSLLAIQFQEAQSDAKLPSRQFVPMKTLDAYVMVPLVSAKSYHLVYDVIGRPEWRQDPAYASMAGIAAHRREIEAALAAWVASQTTEACVETLSAAGVPVSVYAAPVELFDDPHLIHRGVFAELSDTAGAFTVLNPPFRLSGLPCGAAPAVARAGQDTHETVRTTLALDEAEFGRLQEGGAFG
jgi:crotonobetainyl-CoA:carnitine CoA-transferase CaiB-like acyl-CoA transferase